MKSFTEKVSLSHLKRRIIKLTLVLYILSAGHVLLPGAAFAGKTDHESDVPTLTVEAIRVSGNSKTRQQVILSQLDFGIGEKISRLQLENNRRRLKQSNFYKGVNVFTQPGSQKGKVEIHIEIQERRWPFFQFKSGFSELDGWFISPLGLRFDNFFGRGNLMGFEFLIGDRIFGTDIVFFRPDFMQSDLDFQVRLFSRNRQFLHYIQGDKYKQDVTNDGLSLRFNGRRGLLKFLWLEFRRETFQVKDNFRLASDDDEKLDTPQEFRPYLEKKDVGRLMLSLYADTRDQSFYPTTGWWGSVSFGQVSKEFGAFDDYKKVSLDVRRYLAITGQVVLAVRARAAYVDDWAPFYEKFYLGGPNSLRGYKDRSLNPVGYASRLLQGGAELRFPISRHNFPHHFLSAVLFYDVGEAWNEADQFSSDALKSGAGFGFRIKLPLVGLLRLDFAYAVPDYDFKLHLSLGHTF